jgi:hypothetical protein
VSWSRKLFEPIVIDDGRIFSTLRDAAEFMLKLSQPRRDKSHWQFAAEAMFRAAQPNAAMHKLLEAEASVKAALSADGVLRIRQ